MRSDFLAESLVIRKLYSARKKAPENSRRPFLGNNPIKMDNYTNF